MAGTSNHKQTPAVIVIGGGHAGTDARDRAIQEGAIGFLQKPFSDKSLMELVLKQEAKNSRS